MGSKRYVFIMGHPRSGSTLLKEILATSSDVSVMPKEGLKLIDELTPPNFGFNIWNPNIDLDFKLIKKKWHVIWDLKKKLLIEKSPPLILRFDQIYKSFNECFFLFLIRNPYAYVASVRKRFPNSSPYCIAKFWCVMAVYIKNGFIKYENDSNLIRYEDLTDRTEDTIEAVLKKLSGLGVLDVNRIFRISNRESKITNMNIDQINSLNSYEIYLINKALKANKHLLDFFDYNLKEYKYESAVFYLRKYFEKNNIGHHAKLLKNFNLEKLGVK